VALKKYIVRRRTPGPIRLEHNRVATTMCQKRVPQPHGSCLLGVFIFPFFSFLLRVQNRLKNDSRRALRGGTLTDQLDPQGGKKLRDVLMSLLKTIPAGWSPIDAREWPRRAVGFKRAWWLHCLSGVVIFRGRGRPATGKTRKTALLRQ